MTILSNTAVQTVAAGETVVLNSVVLKTGTGECYRPNTSSIKLRKQGIYEVSFSANVASATAGAVVQLNIMLGDIALPESTMKSTPSTANAFNSVAKETAVKNCCGDFDRITVKNTGTNPITIDANPVLYVKRQA